MNSHLRNALIHFFKKQVPSFASRSRRVFFWLPILSLTLGTIASFKLYSVFKEQEQRSLQAEFSKRARDITERIDLSLANSTLKIQNYEELIGLTPRQYRNGGITFLESALPHTVFQRLTIFQEVPVSKKDSSKGFTLKPIFRITLPEANFSNSKDDFLESDDIYPKLIEMKKGSKSLEAFLFERSDQVRLSVLMNSKVQKNIYFFFTAPFANLFQQNDFTIDDIVTVSHLDNHMAWILKFHKNIGDLKLIKNPLPNFQFEIASENNPMTYPLSRSGLPVSLHYQFAPKDISEISSATIVLFTGLIITFILSYLFYVLITGSRSTYELLKIRTIDLEKTANELQDALETKNKFLGKVSHEIRTPLNLILGMVDLCQEQDADGKFHQYLRGMKSSGEHLLYMIDDLIDLAKSDNNELHFNMRTISTMSLLTDMLKLIGQTCHKKGLMFYAQLDADLPQNIICDPNRLRQVLMNLLRNATKYTESGHVIFRAYAQYANDESCEFTFEIEDTGSGIPTDKINKIFDAFFQVEEKSSAIEGGAGLGLSIVRDLLHKMNGQVDVISEAGKGSLFTVRISLNTPEPKSWIDTFKPVEKLSLNLIFVSTDPLFFSSYTPLMKKEELIIHHTSPESLHEVVSSLDKPSAPVFLILDARVESPSLQSSLSSFQTERIFIISSQNSANHKTNPALLSGWPALPSDLLPQLGYSSRSSRRQEPQPQYFINDGKIKLKKSSEGARLLVADDDLGNTELYKAYFESSPWKVDYSDNGLTAWEAYLKVDPHLCILDLRMPLMDGFEVIAKIREHEASLHKKHVPILLITADLVEKHIDRARTFDNVEVLTKPIRKKNLFEVIQNKIT